MKREKGDHFDRIMTYTNVTTAWALYNAQRPMALRREFDEKKAREIHEKMKTDFKEVIGSPRRKTIHEAGKQRELEIPPFEAIIAMLAMWNVCGEAIDRRVHPQSFSSRKGMGGHLAERKAEKFVHINKDGDAKYCWYFDIRQFYKHINKRIMVSRIEAIFKDKRIVELFKVVIDSTPVGLPIGYPFSHALANLYLVPLYYLIMSVKGVSKTFVYMDNWNVFSQFKKPLHKALVLAKNWLAGMGCSIKPDWQIYPTVTRGVKICGFVIYAEHSTRLYRRIWHRIMHNVDRYKVDPTEELYLSLMSRLGWLKAINKHTNVMFKINKGDYLWKN